MEGEERFTKYHLYQATCIYCVIQEEHEDFYGLLEYMNINPVVNPVVIVNIKEEKKYVFAVTSKQFTFDGLFQFLEDFSQGKIE